MTTTTTMTTKGMQKKRNPPPHAMVSYLYLVWDREDYLCWCDHHLLWKHSIVNNIANEQYTTNFIEGKDS